MAKMKHFDVIPANSPFHFLGEYDPSSIIQTVHTSRKSAYLDLDSQWGLEFSGTHLKYKGDILIGGTVTKVTFLDGDGEQVGQISGIKLNALKVPDPVRPDGVLDMYSAFMKGNDVLTGGAEGDRLFGAQGNDKLNGGLGDDFVEGGRGNDTLSGGEGSDVFIGGVGMGKDVVLDFIATGAGHDYIGFFEDLPTWSQVGDDVVVLFSGGSQLLLKGVDADDITVGDDFIGGCEPTML